jgi:serine/threonine protein phosphatase PrpC
MLRALCLLGRDFPTLGPLGLAGFPDGGAIALSRGARPKPYRHVDPNEDAGLLVREGAGRLLAVADGFNGRRASEIAIERLRARASELLVSEVGAFEAAARALLEAIARDLADVGPSRTCLLFAALVGPRCHWASLGDSHLFRATAPEPVNGSSSLVLGPRLPRLPAAPHWCDSFEREPGERIALASDGVANFVADPARIHAFVQEAASDRDAVRRLALEAMRGGAGDNVVVVAAA